MGPTEDLDAEVLQEEATTKAASAGLSLERMMGLEPTTFCMASGSWIRAKERRKPHG
jgi:hypothetical protein